MPSGFNYKAGKSRKLGVPGGSGSNQLMGYMLSQQKAQNAQGMQEQERQTQASGIGDIIGNVKQQFPEGTPPGSTLNVGENVSANVPLNRELTQDERADLEHYSTLERYIDSMEGLMNKDPNRFQEVFAKANLPGSNLLTLGDQEAINMNRALKDWSDRILRARSKSQTTEKEFGRIRQFAVPTLRDITVTQDPATQETYPTIRNMFSGVKQSIERGRGMILGGALSQEYGGQTQLNQPQQTDQDNDPLGLFK